MPRILYDPDSQRLLGWPRLDDEDVVGLQLPVVMLTIEQQPPPTDFDPAIYGVHPTQDVDLDALALRRGWELRPLPPPPPPPPRWVQFGLALVASEQIRDFLWAVESVNPALREMIGVGLGQAAQGDAQTFLAAWGQAVAGGLVPPELAHAMAVLAENFDLPAAFVEALG